MVFLVTFMTRIVCFLLGSGARRWRVEESTGRNWLRTDCENHVGWSITLERCSTTRGNNFIKDTCFAKWNSAQFCPVRGRQGDACRNFGGTGHKLHSPNPISNEIRLKPILLTWHIYIVSYAGVIRASRNVKKRCVTIYTAYINERVLTPPIPSPNATPSFPCDIVLGRNKHDDSYENICTKVTFRTIYHHFSSKETSFLLSSCRCIYFICNLFLFFRSNVLTRCYESSNHR